MGLLTATIFTPLLGAVFVLLQPDERATWRSAFIFSLLPLGLSFYLYAAFIPGVAGYQFVEHGAWIPEFGITYYLGMDGISLFLVILTTILFTLSLLYSGGGDIEKRPREFCFFMLVLETGLLGALLSIDLFLFYVFWEVMLIPMYFLIGIWGHGRKVYAAFKFILYTMLGSILMLIAILYLVSEAHAHLGYWTFDLPDLYKVPLSPDTARWLFAAFAFGFAIKVPLWPVHTWLPDAHTEAPTAGSVILAGVMLKLGTYGFLRFAIPLFPQVAVETAPLFLALAVIGIIYGALVAMVQPDLKRLVAYSSVSHLGFVMLGIFALDPQGMQGALYEMLNHGVSTGALFLLVGMIYLRRHTREISEFGGLWHSVPIYAAIFMVVMLSSIGLPGLNGFVGEFLILLGAYLTRSLAADIAVIGLILGALYLLYAYERVMFGPITKAVNQTIRDLGAREIAVMVPLVALMLFMGIYPQPLLRRMGPSLDVVLSRVHVAQAQLERKHNALAMAAMPWPDSQPSSVQRTQRPRTFATLLSDRNPLQMPAEATERHPRRIAVSLSTHNPDSPAAVPGIVLMGAK